jgi:predicted ATPase
MLIKHLKVAGLLSFGRTGIDLPMQGLNVFIGPNGSGKSNLIEVLALLRACPKNLPAPVKEMGGMREWLWKGKDAPKEAVIEAVVSNPGKSMDLRHWLGIREHGTRFEVADERIEDEQAYAGKSEPHFYYRYQRGHPAMHGFQGGGTQAQAGASPARGIHSFPGQRPGTLPGSGAVAGRVCQYSDVPELVVRSGSVAAPRTKHPGQQ